MSKHIKWNDETEIIERCNNLNCIHGKIIGKKIIRPINPSVRCNKCGFIYKFCTTGCMKKSLTWGNMIGIEHLHCHKQYSDSKPK